MQRSAIWPRLDMMSRSPNEDWRCTWVESMNGRVKLAVCFSISLFACAGSVCAQQQVIGAPPEASNMKLVGFNDLQARSALTIVVKPGFDAGIHIYLSR